MLLWSWCCWLLVLSVAAAPMSSSKWPRRVFPVGGGGPSRTSDTPCCITGTAIPLVLPWAFQMARLTLSTILARPASDPPVSSSSSSSDSSPSRTPSVREEPLEDTETPRRSNPNRPLRRYARTALCLWALRAFFLCLTSFALRAFSNASWVCS